MQQRFKKMYLEAIDDWKTFERNISQLMDLLIQLDDSARHLEGRLKKEETLMNRFQ